MMKLISGAVLSVVLVYSSAAFAGFGATALNASTGASGEAYGYPSQEAAINAALQACGAGCTMINWEENTCVALATNGSGGWGEGHGYPTQAAAEQEALNACGAGCSVVEWACE